MLWLCLGPSLPALSWTTLPWLLDNSLQEKNQVWLPLPSSLCQCYLCRNGNLKYPAYVSQHPHSMQHVLIPLGCNNTSTAGSSTALTSFQSLWTEKEHTHNNNDVLGLQVHDTESGRDSSLGVLWSCHGPRRSCPHTNELRRSPGLRARNQTCFHLAIQMCPHSFRSLNGVRWSPHHACKCHWQSPLFPAPDICQPG